MLLQRSWRDVEILVSGGDVAMRTTLRAVEVLVCGGDVANRTTLRAGNRRV